MEWNQSSFKDAARRLSSFTKSKEATGGLSYNQALEGLSRAAFNRSWEEVRVQLGESDTPSNSKPSAWDNNALQFPRVIDEARAAGAFTPEILEVMGDSMDLSVVDLVSLLDRAQCEWDRIKQGHTKSKPVAGLPAVMLVDESSIPASFGGMTLFLNGMPVLTADEQNDYPIEDVASNMAEALNTHVIQVRLDPRELAVAVATENQLEPPTDEETDFEEWHQGYTDEDVRLAVQNQLSRAVQPKHS